MDPMTLAGGGMGITDSPIDAGSSASGDIGSFTMGGFTNGGFNFSPVIRNSGGSNIALYSVAALAIAYFVFNGRK